MKKHDFTPEQSELILNAVSKLIGLYGNAYRPMKQLSVFKNDYLHRIAEDAPEEVIKSLDLQKILYHSENIENLLFEIEEARNMPFKTA